jgi:hypothetical protein
MKNFLLLLCLYFCLSGESIAQTNRGAKLVGGTGTLHIGTKSKGTLLSLSPRFGYFAADNLAVGASLPLSLFALQGATTTIVGLSPFVRGYFGTTPTRFLLEARVGYQHYGYNSGDSDFKDTASTFTYGIGIGAAHFITDQVGLEFILSYDESGNNDAIFNLANLTGINMNVGFQIYLPAGK